MNSEERQAHLWSDIVSLKKKQTWITYYPLLVLVKEKKKGEYLH